MIDTRLAIAPLALAAAAFAPSTHAVSLNPNGTGQVLLVPFYATQGGNDTLLAIANTDSDARAVKLRLNESRLGRPVQDLNLYLGPNDTWTAAVIDGAGFGMDSAALLINDSSCVVPTEDAMAAMITLDDGRRVLPMSDPGNTDIPFDKGPQGLDRTRNGSIEIIEMAVIAADSPTGDALALLDGAPADCGAITQAWHEPDGDWTVNPDLDMTAPHGRGVLTATVMIVDPARGSLFEVPVDALVGFNHQSLHTAPGAVEPTLASVNDADDPDLATAVVVAGNGEILTATYADDLDSGYGKIDAVSALFMASSLSNDYFLTRTDAVQAHSEWVFHLPTRRFYVDTAVQNGTGNQFVAGARAPFPGDAGTRASCNTGWRVTYIDRAGQRRPLSTGVFDPPPPGIHLRDPLCWQTNAFSIGPFDHELPPASPILGDANGYQLSWPPQVTDEGRILWNFLGGNLREPLEGTRFSGVPVTGFFVTVFDNAFVEGGTLANYATSFRHRITQSPVDD